MSDAIKVIFIQDMGDGDLQKESLWCSKEEDGYVVDNIPFIAKNISLGDTIKVEFDEEDQAYYFEDFVAESGNTTVRVILWDGESIDLVGKALEQFGCEWEGFTQWRLIAVNIHKDLDYGPVKKFLAEGENSGRWTFEESCLCHRE